MIWVDQSQELSFGGICQGCQVAVATAPLLKSGRRKKLGAVKIQGREGPWKVKKGSKVAVEKIEKGGEKE
jgi:hypothetical protein